MQDRSTNVVGEVLAHLKANEAAGLERLRSVLRIPSISTDPAHADDCVRAAEWFREQLAELDFNVSMHPTPGHPVVLARRPGPVGVPHVLIYGHYDVQPPDPLPLWDSPPFDPQVVDGPHGKRVVARGAVDDKGQCLMWLEALRAWHEVAGGPPVGVTVLMEGEEEVMSPSLDPFLVENVTTLKADFALISDTLMWNVDTPAFTTRLRGTVLAEVRLRGASRDLHSGLYGGSAFNPINALTGIMGALHDPNGKVTLPGFYDGVSEPTAAELREWDVLGFDEAKFLGEVGLFQAAGEAGRSALERLWTRPTADINGIWGGYQGKGTKTVIAAEAGAKVSFRLVAGQDPIAIAASLEQFCRERVPADAKIDVEIAATRPACVFPNDSRWLACARRALAPEYDRKAVTVGVGGSLPVVESFSRILGLETLLMGFGLEDDKFHSPNEKFELTCFHRGARSHVRLLAELAR